MTPYSKISKVRLYCGKVAVGEKKRHGTALITSTLQQRLQELGFHQKDHEPCAAAYEGIEIKGRGTIGAVTYIRQIQ